jgi:hypothetical protein
METRRRKREEKRLVDEAYARLFPQDKRDTSRAVGWYT